MSFIKGVAVFCLNILVFNNLKSTTGLLSFVSLHINSVTGEVWLVLFLDKIPKNTSLSIFQSSIVLSFSLIGNGLTKKEDSSTTSKSILIFGHCPILSHKLEAALC